MAGKVIVRQSVQEEYQKTGISPSDIATLQQWLKTQPHMPEPYITELDLILTYHSCCQSMEVSKQVLDLHYTLRTLFNNLFLNRIVDENIIKILNVFLNVPLAVPSTDNCKVVYLRLIDTDTKNFVYMDLARVVIMQIDLLQLEEGTWPGLILLFDLDGVTLGHLAKLDLSTVQQMIYYLQEAMLVKLKGLHFMNATAIMNRLLLIIKPFMKKELIQMLFIHPLGATTLEKFVPLKALPKDAGGEYKTYEEVKNEWIDKMKANSDFFFNENKKRVAESLRPGKPKTIANIFGGVEGSFKKLDID
ncbi:unnamed protein product, partial [Brenthis ino]